MNKVKKVTLKLSPGTLAKHGGSVQGTPVVESLDPFSEPVTSMDTPTATPPPVAATATATNNTTITTGISRTAAPKLSSNIRVGVSGLTMNTATQRKVDRSNKKVSKFVHSGKFKVRTFNGYEIKFKKWLAK